MIRSRRTPQSYDQVLEKVQVNLAKHKSLLEDGAAVDVDRLDADWTAPSMFPDHFPDRFFTRD